MFVSILSLNCWVHFYDKTCPLQERAIRMEKIATWILDQQPDIVTLQECFLLKLPFFFTPLGTECMETLRLALCKGGYVCYFEGPKHTFCQNGGLFMASKLKFLESKTIDFQSENKTWKRKLASKVNGKGFQYARFELNSKDTIQVVNVHNDAFSLDARKQEHAQIQAYLQEKEENVPTIIIGDFNCASKDELEEIRQLYNLPNKTSGDIPTHLDQGCYDQCCTSLLVRREEVFSEAKLSDHFPLHLQLDLDFHNHNLDSDPDNHTQHSLDLLQLESLPDL